MGSLLRGTAGLQEPSHTVHTTALDASSPRTFLSVERPLAAHTPAGRGPPAPLESPLWFCSAHGSSFPSRLQAKQDDCPLAQRPRERRSPRAPAPGFPMPAKLPQVLRPTLCSPAIMLSRRPQSGSVRLKPVKQSLPGGGWRDLHPHHAGASGGVHSPPNPTSFPAVSS